MPVRSISPKDRIDNLSAVRRDRLRNQQLGMVFQFYHLLPELTTLENVILPAMIAVRRVALLVTTACDSRGVPNNCWNGSG